MKFTEKIKSVNALIPEAISLILRKIRSQVKLSEDHQMQLRLILEEALTNAARYGNKFDLGLEIIIDVEFENGTFVFTVTDQGKGFDPSAVPDPMTQTELKSSGRGIYLMRKLADEVRFNDKGNVITIVKKISPAA